jgi:hypothetical protein
MPGEPVENGLGPAGALLWGLRAAWACRRLLILILAANLLLAAGVLYPLLAPMDDSLSRHPEAGRIGRQLDAKWWGDWTRSAAVPVRGSVGLLSLASLVMVLAGTFFAGGLLEALRFGPRKPLRFEPLPDPWYEGQTPEWRASEPGPASVREFLRSSARHFPRFLVLLLLSMPLYWVVQRILNHHAVIALDALLEGVEDERLGMLLTFLRAGLFVCAFHAVTVFFEYARVHEVLKPGAPLLALFATPARLLVRRPAAVLGIEAGAFLLHLAAMGAFIPVDRLLGRGPVIAVTAGFLATQIFLLARIWIRAGAQAAQIRLARALLPGS